MVKPLCSLFGIITEIVWESNFFFFLAVVLDYYDFDISQIPDSEQYSFALF